ncbi:acyltransferase family protein [Kushneria indalinina]|uniref:Fucose 4-O-acetylase-like acetyltransferase n=1 Tax=Kushneria indalinina DSM 14324 TaxID=1122140 RepID=A0A3D9DUA1_9GAMM|nr:acyltransferase family protein [Kushneria indalinina]REC94336.1 fucose 4-O-acetylase-like acetyltransferase [Kushneria indalinina DSM 14324]
MAKKLEWINILKGLGIMMVVYAHMTSGFWRNFLFLFHMPLFFIIAGYLFRPNADLKAYLGRKSLHLLVPYGFFMALLYAPTLHQALGDDQSLSGALLDMTLGGRALISGLAAFWFVTCFWATQQLVNVLLTRLSVRTTGGIMVMMLGLAAVNQWFFRELWLIGNLNVVLMAAPCFYLGYLVAHYQLEIEKPRVLLPAILVGLFSMWMVQKYPGFKMDMKYADYGMPVLSLLAAFAITLVMMALSRQLARVPVVSKAVGLVGDASMVIMFLHMSIQVTLDHHGMVEALAPRWLLMMGLPVLLYLLIRQNAWSRLLCLGDPTVLSERRARRDARRQKGYALASS